MIKRDMTKFKKFFGKRYRFHNKKPFVSISKHGSFYFNTTTVKLYIDDFEHATLFYNGEDKEVGLQFFYSPTPESYPVIKNKKSKGRYITCPNFFKYFQIPHERTKHYDFEWESEENMLVIWLGDNGA